MRPAISFVIPAYNAACTLGRTLSSLIAQTRCDWQAIVVEDGSTDATAHVASWVAAEDRRIILHRISNSGACHARNEGLRFASADWIAFLDADDWVAETFCEAMLAAATNDVDLIYCGYRRIVPGTGIVMEVVDPRLERQGFELLARLCPVAIHSVVVRRDLIVWLGGFDLELTCCEDWDLWQRAARVGARIKAIPEILANYRMGTAISLSANHQRMLEDGLIVLRRGYGPDSRVSNALPQYANGLPADGMGLQATFFAAWCAAVEVGAGGDGVPLLGLLQGPHDVVGHEACLAETIVDALVIGSRTPKGEIADRYTSFQRQLSRLVSALAAGQVRAGVERNIRSRIEQDLLMCYAGTRELTLGLWSKCIVDLLRPRDLVVPPGSDTMAIELWSGTRYLCRLEVPVFGSLSRGDVVELAMEHLGLRRFLVHARFFASPGFWGMATARLIREICGNRRAAIPSRSRGLGGVRRLLRAALRDTAICVAGARSPSQGRARVKAILEALGALSVRMEKPQDRAAASISLPPKNRSEIWDDVFAEPDPWHYGSEYEQQKYRYTLDLIPETGIAKALELGCAEGMFSTLLAPRAKRLIAADISARALDRARARCAAQVNIEFRQIDLVDDELPAHCDLIVCSEVLYYLDGVDELDRIARKVCDALAPGGQLVIAHHFLLKDDMSATGFDWDQNYGGKVVHDRFGATPGLILLRSIVTELYRIDRFQKVEGNQASAAPKIQMAALDCALEPSLMRFIVWGGASARRRSVEHERTWQLPVLAYHRIAHEGPDGLSRWRVRPEVFQEHIRLLRSLGYSSVTSQQVIEHSASAQPFRGRPVLITFDDGYADFAEAAWPILATHDFMAEVFLVTDHIGGVAAWDSCYGHSAPLMDWATIERLHYEGVSFGSHLASHTPAPNLSSDTLLTEAVRSRWLLEARLGTPIRSIAAPYGAIDMRLHHIARLAGYQIGFSCNRGLTDIRYLRFNLPRIEVAGDWSALQLAHALGLVPAFAEG